ncbi:acyltransferase family protein [Dictyobacter alpinus]|nr:acyltransferase family protein [Dictyobacter alpinus]
MPYFFINLHIDWNLRWLATVSFHLWFLAFLFLISAATLPLLMLLRRETGRRFIHKLASVAEKRGALLLFAIPIVFMQIILRAPFPGYQNWADCCTWVICFIYGYILASDTRFEQAIRSEKGLMLLIASVCIFLVILFYLVGYVARWEASPYYSIGYIFYQILRGLIAWSLLALALYIALRFMNFSSRLLLYANEAALPFYIVHYPIIVISAFFIKGWSDNIPLKFLLLSSISLTLTLLVYELLVRRIRMLRLLFGMKVQKKILASTVNKS